MTGIAVLDGSGGGAGGSSGADKKKEGGGGSRSNSRNRTRPRRNNNKNGDDDWSERLREMLPKRVVCTSKQPESMELGLLLSMFIFALFFYGVFESMLSLPEPTSRHWKQVLRFNHFGKNLNVAVMKQQQQHADTGGGSTARREEEHDNDNKEDSNDSIDDKQVFHPAKDATGQIIIPKAVWPVPSLESEKKDGLWEEITHPGDGTTTMMVPKLWSKPVHDGKLLKRSLAMKIGSCTEADGFGNFQRGEDCPLEKRTIYLAVASYRDFQCRDTVASMFQRARYPERLRVGIIDQIQPGVDVECDKPHEPCEENPGQTLCEWKDQIERFEMEAELSVGPVFARHLGYRLYRGEYYTTQSDAHVSYTQDWDVDIIDQLEITQNEMAVLSTYLTDVQGSIDEKTGRSLRNTRPIMCSTIYEGGPQGMHLRHAQQPERPPSVHGQPQLQPWWAAGYSFSRGHFIVNVPYDGHQPMIFQGEEMSIGIRGFTIGYDYYAPERSVCFHHYAVGANAAKRNKVKHFWENSNLYEGTGKKAMARLLGIVHMNPEIHPSFWDHTEEDLYGIGGVRTPEKFYETFGIDVVKKTVQGHMCEFIDNPPKMHKTFTKHLRKDGMGIDYANIDFHWVDPHGQPKINKSVH